MVRWRDALRVGQAVSPVASAYLRGPGNRSLFITIAALVVFFTAFNLLEATLPSLISKFAPPGHL